MGSADELYRSAVVRIQMLSELEEVISYKEATAAGNVDRRNVIQKTWMKRCAIFPAPFVVCAD